MLPDKKAFDWILAQVKMCIHESQNALANETASPFEIMSTSDALHQQTICYGGLRYERLPDQVNENPIVARIIKIVGVNVG